MSCLEKFGFVSQKRTISDDIICTNPQKNKRASSCDTNLNILSSTTTQDKISTDAFVSLTPLKKKRALFVETNKDNQPSSSKPLLEDSKEPKADNKSHTSDNSIQCTRTRNHISGQNFKDIIYGCYYDDFCKPYKKLNSKLLPDCCDLEACDKKHKNTQPKEIATFTNGTFFSILDNPLSNWLYDISTAAFTVLRPELYFSGDVLRILFDYLLNGPEENLVWDVKHILSSHLELHPPCTERMRQFYQSLLNEPFSGEPYFKTELIKMGILNHVINQLEEGYELNKPLVQEEESEESVNSQAKADSEELTFEKLERRWNNFEPLLEIEYNEVVGALDELGKSSSQEVTELDTTKSKKMPRLAIALELIVDILEADFLICVSKLKKYISSESSTWVLPLVKHFMDDNLHNRVFLLYVRATDQTLWIQLSRLMSVMAEFEHLFKPFPQQFWHYPYLHCGCKRFATSFCNALDKSEWNEEERLLRLEMLHPAWLRLQVAMHWLNSDLKIGVGSDLKALVDTIHMHIISPVKFEKDIHFKVNDVALNNQAPEFVKNAIKKNQYGETLLHRLCKDKKSSKSKLFILLSLPEVDVNAKDNFGWTPLHEAVLTNSAFKTKTLLQYQPPPGRLPVDPGAQNSQGSTPLHEAVIAKNLEICKLLVEYGGACLLSKTDCEGVTPLQLAKGNADIKKYFDRVIKTQELLNLSPNSVLNLSEFTIKLLVLACSSFLDDHHTRKVYHETRFNPTPKKLKQKKWIVIDQQTLISFKTDQEQFKKLRKILNKLSENPKNISLVKMWDLKFQSVLV